MRKSFQDALKETRSTSESNDQKTKFLESEILRLEQEKAALEAELEVIKTDVENLKTPPK